MEIQTTTPIQVQAPAKLNLGLRIDSRRGDGYHTLETVFQTIDLADVLTISLDSDRSDDHLTVEGAEDLPAGPNNLALQAVKLLRKQQVPFPPVNIHLEKNIPIGAGLGGGSSDAAAVLKTLSQWFESSRREDISVSDLARSIGADVPFFLEGGTRLARGIGDQLSELPDLEGFAVIGVPDYSVSTSWAYKHYRDFLPEGRNGHRDIVPEEVPGNRMSWHHLKLSNDFEPLIEHTYDLHRELISALGRWSEKVSLSGSGSAVYGLFEMEDEAEDALLELRDRFPEVGWFLTRFLASESISQM